MTAPPLDGSGGWGLTVRFRRFALGLSFAGSLARGTVAGSLIRLLDLDGGRVCVLAEVELEAVAVLGGVGAVGAPVLVDVRVRLHVRVEHRLVDARVRAFGTFERFGAEVVAHVVLEVMFVLGHERTLGARQQLLGFDVRTRVLPEAHLVDGHELALFALETLGFARSGDASGAPLAAGIDNSVSVAHVRPQLAFGAGREVAVRALDVKVRVEVGLEVETRSSRIRSQMALVDVRMAAILTSVGVQCPLQAGKRITDRVLFVILLLFHLFIILLLVHVVGHVVVFVFVGQGRRRRRPVAHVVATGHRVAFGALHVTAICRTIRNDGRIVASQRVDGADPGRRRRRPRGRRSGFASAGIAVCGRRRQDGAAVAQRRERRAERRVQHVTVKVQHVALDFDLPFGSEVSRFRRQQTDATFVADRWRRCGRTCHVPLGRRERVGCDARASGAHHFEADAD